MYSIIDLICKTLATAYPNYTIYTEQVQQGFCEPCFFIEQINATHAQQVGNRYRQVFDLCIHYFSAADEQAVNSDLYAMADELTACLEMLEYGEDKLHGSGMNYKVVDGTLHFFVTAYRYLKRPITATEMAEVEIREGVK